MASDRSSTTTAQGRIGHCLAGAESLVECLARQFGLTCSDAEWLVSFGSVYLERRRVSSDQRLSEGQYVRVHLQPKRFPVEGIDWRATIVHEDDQFVVINKPAGIPVHPTVDNGVENVCRRLDAALGGVFLTQRLDIDVSGLIVFAKTREFQRKFNRLLGERKVRKHYQALVTSAPEVGRHVHYMEPSKWSPRRVSMESQPGWLTCVLQVIDVRPVGDLFEVDIDLETGRTHQIRTQLAALRSPIVGDSLYGSETHYQSTGIGLFSASTMWVSEGREWSFHLPAPWRSWGRGGGEIAY